MNNNKYRDISISWMGDVTSVSGNAQHARALLEPLIKGGANVHLLPLKTNRAFTPLGEFWDKALERCTKNPPGVIMINHGHPKNVKPNITGGPTILLTHWETKDVPKTWIKHIKAEHYSEVWLTSEGTLASAERQLGNKPLRVMKYPIDTSKYAPAKGHTEVVGVDDRSFVFGSTGLWNNRKNFSDLICAFYGEFTAGDDVVLLLKTCGQDPGNPNERQRLIGLIRELRGSFSLDTYPKVVVLQDTFGYDAMDAIIRRMDCFVSASRGESRNITMMKAMSMGKPCICIEGHANSDLSACGVKHIMQVSHGFEPVMQMGGYYSGKDIWPRPDVCELMSKMRGAYELYMGGVSRAEQSKVKDFLKEKYSPELIEKELVGALRELNPIAMSPA